MRFYRIEKKEYQLLDPQNILSFIQNIFFATSMC